MKENNKPFFLAIGYVSPHLPFIQPKKYWDMYEHEKIELADNPFQPKNSPDIAIEAQHNSAELRKNYLNIPANGPLGDDLSRDLIHGYFASVSYMDVLIGELVDALDNLGLRDNTTCTVEDHGYFWGSMVFGASIAHSTRRYTYPLLYHLQSFPTIFQQILLQSLWIFIQLYVS